MVNRQLTLPLTWIKLQTKAAVPPIQCAKFLCIRVCVKEKFVSVQVQTRRVTMINIIFENVKNFLKNYFNLSRKFC